MGPRAATPAAARRRRRDAWLALLPRGAEPGAGRGDGRATRASSSWGKRWPATTAPTRSRKGLLDKFGSARVVDAPISELGFGGLGVGAAMGGLRPVIEMMTWNFAILAMDQIVNSAAKLRHMSGGQLRCPIVFRGPNGAGGRLSLAAQPGARGELRPLPRPQGDRPGHAGRRQGAAQGRHPRRQPGHLHRRRAALRRPGARCPTASTSSPSARPTSSAQGSDVTLVTWSRMLTAVALPAAEVLAQQGVRRRGARPAHHAAARRGGHRRLGEEDQPRGGAWKRAGATPASARTWPTSSSASASTISTPRCSRVHGPRREHGLRREPRAAILPSVARVVAAVNQVLYR